MASTSLEERVRALEREVARLKALVNGPAGTSTDWLDTVWGAFAGDPAFEEAMRYGREWRESFRPKEKAKTRSGKRRRA